jgi:3',5'-cyclic AMP phosphodiesterase CpdA
VAEILKQLSNQGIKVFVVPGNHDILNPDAKAYSGTGSEPTENITAADFAEIYSEFGYENAFSRDCNSLSYITQPFNNLWILGIDANKYYENTPAGPARSGKIKPETMEWMLKWLAEAKKNNITVLALMHHGMMEVCTGQETFYKGYVIDDREACADALTDAGLRAIFTGHFHSNDITMRKKGENTLFDIKTGSLLTPPSPYRIINMDPNYMNINTYHITSIDAAIPGGADFVSYSTEYLFKNMTRLMTGLFMSPSYNMPQETAVTLAPHFAKGLGVLYASDGQLSAEEEVFVNGLPTQLKTVIISFYTDLPPNDLQYVVDMRKKLR